MENIKFIGFMSFIILSIGSVDYIADMVLAKLPEWIIVAMVLGMITCLMAIATKYIGEL